MKPLPKRITNKILSNKKLSENDAVQLCMWGYFGIAGSLKRNRQNNFTHCGAGIECALREAYQHGRDSVKETK